MTPSPGHFTGPLLALAGPPLVSAGWDTQVPALLAVGSLQRLVLLERGQVASSWPLSSAVRGFGCLEGSGMTPTGMHRIAQCIGDHQPPGMRFVSRQATGEIVAADPGDGRDYITSRILWLQGLEPGHNLGPGRDSFQRYIYIHGTPHRSDLGRAASAGCLRLADEDIIDLFPRVNIGTLVLIVSDLQPSTA
ncbi:MAG: L,D-transpeptidase [Magnetococcus sp. WYHC-3]